MSLILHPKHSEKSFRLHAARQYTFLVDAKANKIEIKKAIAELYNVVVTDVNTAYYAGKHVQRYTRKSVIEGKRKNYKKAIVTLQKGDMIDIHKDSL